MVYVLKLNNKTLRISALSMITLIIGMILVTPVLSCPAGTNCSQNETGTVTDCPNCKSIGELSNVTDLSTEKVGKNLKISLESTDIRKLISELKSKGYKLNKADVYGLGATQADGSYIEGLALPFESPDNSSAGIYVVFKDDKISKAEAKILSMDQNKVFVKILTVKDNNVITKSSDISIDSNTATPMITVNGCSTCKYLAKFVCKKGCSKGGQLLCSMADLTVVGGVACTVAVYLLCKTIGSYGCGQTADFLCKKAGFC